MYCHRFSDRCRHQLTNSCCRNHLTQITHYLADLFDREKIFYWMHFGTLLSAVREGGEIIPWDSDADLGVFASSQRMWTLKKEIEEAGYYWSEHHEHLIQIGYSERNWTYCDIWLYERVPSLEHGVGDKVSTDLELDIPIDKEPINNKEEIVKCKTPWMQINHTCDFPYWFLEEIEQLPFEGRLMNCPRHPNKFIEFLYGPSWNEPIKKNDDGYCGNYYPLSYWLDYVELQRELKQPRNILRLPSNPCCRFDTEKCKKVKDCCMMHKKELTSFILETLTKNEIKFKINEDFVIEIKDYDRVFCLREFFDAHYYSEFFVDKINLYYSEINRNKVVIHFT